MSLKKLNNMSEIIDYKQLAEVTNSSDVKTWQTKVAEHEEKLKDYKAELKRVNEIMVVGVCVLLVMVGTLVWTAFTDWRHSVQDATDQINNQRWDLQQKEYQFQQQEIQNLQQKPASSSANG